MADMLRGGIIINEILVDPNSTANNFDTDGNGAAAATDEYVELFNTTGSAIDIGGLQLWDEANDDWFTFPAGTMLEGNGHAMVMTGVQAGGSLPTTGPDDLAFDAGLGSAIINNGGDSIVVYDPLADEYIQATYNGASLDSPESTGPGSYDGFSTTATQVGAGENFGSDVDGFSIQRTPDGDSDFVNAEAPTPGDDNFVADVVCFASGSMIDTTKGPVRVEDLRSGDLLVTKDHGEQAIKWIFSAVVSAQKLAKIPELRPIVIKAGGLGKGIPNADLRVSPEHRFLVSGAIARRICTVEEVLISAATLAQYSDIAYVDMDCESVTYTNILCDAHEIITANGAPTDTLFLGSGAREILSDAAWDELEAIYPNLRSDLSEKPPRVVRYMTPEWKAALVVKRHKLHNRPFLS